MFRGVIFDLFHTLTGPDLRLAEYPKTNEVLGIDDDTWQRASIATRGWRLTGSVRDPFEIVRRMADVIDATLPDDLVAKGAAARVKRSAFALGTVPPSNIALLRRLRADGLRLGLISNLDAADVVGWQTCALAGCFDVELLSCEIGLAKPDPAIYALCLEKLGLAGKECLYVGDGAGNELVGARAAGCHTLLFTGMIEGLWPDRIPALAAPAHGTIRRLVDIVPLLRDGPGTTRP